MPQSPKTRCWFQFGLGTMFVVVLLAAIPLGWLGWQLRIVRQRQAMRDWITSIGGAVRPMEAKPYSPYSVNAYEQPIPVWREWLGDETIDYASVPTITRAELDLISMTFPGALIRHSTPPPNVRRTPFNAQTPMPNQ